MNDFIEFYSMGGFFNHVVTLFALAAIATIVQHAAGRATGDPRLLNLVDRLTALGVAAGVLGVVFNRIEMGHALATVGPEMQQQAANLGGAIVPIPLAWALMCAIPLWLATTCMRLRTPATAQ
jgi:hypothetical protein